MGQSSMFDGKEEPLKKDLDEKILSSQESSGDYISSRWFETRLSPPRPRPASKRGLFEKFARFTEPVETRIHRDLVEQGMSHAQIEARNDASLTSIDNSIAILDRVADELETMLATSTGTYILNATPRKEYTLEQYEKALSALQDGTPTNLSGKHLDAHLEDVNNMLGTSWGVFTELPTEEVERGLELRITQEKQRAYEKTGKLPESPFPWKPSDPYDEKKAALAASLRRAQMASELPFEERFEIEGRIGGGTAGDVRVGIDKATGKKVAVKYIRDTVGAADVHLARPIFQREVEFPKRINHPNILPAEGFERPHPDNKKETQFIVVTPYVEDPTLEKLLEGGKRFTINETVAYMRQMADLSVQMHAEGVIHRDIHPGNVFAMSNSTYKVTDFGMARNISTVIGSQHATQHAGNAHRMFYRDYASIKGIVDERSDLITITRSAIAMLRGKHYDAPLGESELLTIPKALRTFLVANSGEIGDLTIAQDAKTYLANLEKALGSASNTATSTAITKPTPINTPTTLNTPIALNYPARASASNQLEPWRRERGFFGRLFCTLYPAALYEKMSKNSKEGVALMAGGATCLGFMAAEAAAVPGTHISPGMLAGSVFASVVLNAFADKEYMPTPGNIGYWTYQGMKKAASATKNGLEAVRDTVEGYSLGIERERREEERTLEVAQIYRQAANAAFDGHYDQVEELRAQFEKGIKRFKRTFGHAYRGPSIQVNNEVVHTSTPDDFDYLITIAKNDVHERGELTPALQLLRGELETTTHQLGAHATNHNPNDAESNAYMKRVAMDFVVRHHGYD